MHEIKTQLTSMVRFDETSYLYHSLLLSLEIKPKVLEASFRKTLVSEGTVWPLKTRDSNRIFITSPLTSMNGLM